MNTFELNGYLSFQVIYNGFKYYGLYDNIENKMVYFTKRIIPLIKMRPVLTSVDFQGQYLNSFIIVKNAKNVSQELKNLRTKNSYFYQSIINSLLNVIIG